MKEDPSAWLNAFPTGTKQSDLPKEKKTEFRSITVSCSTVRVVRGSGRPAGRVGSGHGNVTHGQL